MKNVFILFLSFSIISLTFTSCSSGSNNNTATDKQGKEYTAAYICPMHCAGSGSETAGNCPVCKMEYVKNENHKSDEHSHEGHNHEGHNH